MDGTRRRARRGRSARARGGRARAARRPCRGALERDARPLRRVLRAPPAVTNRLHALASRWSLDDEQSARLERVLAVLAEDERAPSSVRDESAIDVHVADSLSA